MPKKIRKNGRIVMIPKGWDREIASLPKTIQAKVMDAVLAIQIGDLPESSFFKKDLSARIRAEIAAELHSRHVSLHDIATLLGCTVRNTYDILERVREDAAVRVQPGWFLRNIHDRYTELVKHASENKALATQTDDNGAKAAFNRNAIQADKGAADVLLKAAENDLLREALRQGGRKDPDEKPGPENRVDFIQWVFENKILPIMAQKQIEPTEAEVIEEDDDQETSI